VSRRLNVAFVGVNAPGYRSLALDYLHAAVRADLRLDVGSVRFDLDVSGDPWWSAYRVLRLDPSPDVVALPVFCWTAEHVFSLGRLIKTARPEALIVLGGPEVGPVADAVLEQQAWADAIVRGEGEFAFADLLRSYARGGDPGSVPGVTARVSGAIVAGPERAVVEDLDQLPSPFGAPQAVPTEGAAYVETYRGCPHRCAYCFEGKGATRIRSFSWERIEADIDAVASTPGLRSFSFIDPVFNLTTDRLQRLAEIMAPHVARGVYLHTIEVDIERVDDEQAELLYRAGVRSVECGPQSVGATALGLCHRTFDRERFAAGVAACRRAGISVECDLIIGLPGDTAADVLDGIDFVISLDPGKVQLSTLHVLPGTELWERAADLGLSFDPVPPHEVVATRELGFAELRRLEVFGNAAAQTYRAKIITDPRGD
jgi:radical SAM superfamily enzyme YgiQ (UPF0313 family)